MAITAMKKVITDVCEEVGNSTVIKLNCMTCKGCDGELTCEQAYRNNRSCVTEPDLFVSQR